jgi:hypothetical protein
VAYRRPDLYLRFDPVMRRGVGQEVEASADYGMATDAIWYEWEREEVMVPSYFERV